MPDPVPVMLLARFAIDRSEQGSTSAATSRSTRCGDACEGAGSSAPGWWAWTPSAGKPPSSTATSTSTISTNDVSGGASPMSSAPQNASEWIRRAQTGERIEVTRRGRTDSENTTPGGIAVRCLTPSPSISCRPTAVTCRPTLSCRPSPSVVVGDEIHEEVDTGGDGDPEGRSPQGIEREVGTEVKASEGHHGG